MKKKILILITSMLILSITTNVYAGSFYSIMNYDISVYKQTSNKEEYKYASFIKESGTDNIAYCIEPFADLIEEDWHYTYYDFAGRMFNYTEEQANRINDLAYFGYGYDNHWDNKWASITQLLIWRTSHPYDRFEWVDSIYSRNIINPYETEIQKLENLIANKNKIPSFASNSSIGISKHMEFYDTNEVLNYYSITNTKGVNASKDGNKLIIDLLDGNDSGEVSFTRREGNQGKWVYNANSQNVIVRGGYSPVEFKLNFNIVKGRININKIDQDYEKNISQGEGNINGAIFELYDENDELIKTIELDEEGKASVEDLDIGRYKLIEKSSGEGYKKTDNIHDIELTLDNTDINIVITNKVIESKVKIVKTYGSKKDYNDNTMKKEAKVNFDVYDKDDNLIGTITTDEYGTCEILLPYGTYKIVQKNTIDNHMMVDDKIITIDSNSPSEIVLELNDYEIEVPNTGI